MTNQKHQLLELELFISAFKEFKDCSHHKHQKAIISTVDRYIKLFGVSSENLCYYNAYCELRTKYLLNDNYYNFYVIDQLIQSMRRDIENLSKKCEITLDMSNDISDNNYIV